VHWYSPALFERVAGNISCGVGYGRVQNRTDLLAWQWYIGERAVDQSTEADNVAELIAAEPWQIVVGPPVKKKTGGWLIPSKHVFVTWPHDDIPHAHSIYVKREDNGWHAACIYDIHGKLHHR
jgi:hypothetical protein